MNTQQRKYAIERINTLITQKEGEIKAKQALEVIEKFRDFA